MGKLEMISTLSHQNERSDNESANTNIKRFFALDTTTYADGCFGCKETKQMSGPGSVSWFCWCDDMHQIPPWANAMKRGKT